MKTPFGGGEFLNTGMSLGQFGFMDEMEGSGRAQKIENICDKLARTHRDNPYIDFDEVIDSIIESEGLDPTDIQNHEKEAINAKMW